MNTIKPMTVFIKPAIGLIKPDEKYRQINHYTQLTYKGYELLIELNGNRWYYLDGQYHRESAPAIIYTNGYQAWWIHNKLHNLNGPAIEREDDIYEKEYWINGIKYIEYKYWETIFSTEEYVKELVTYCPFTGARFSSREENAVNLDLLL